MSITKKIVADCVKRESALALPMRKRRNSRHQRPLWAWMRGANKSCTSRIDAVLKNQCRWPWTTLKASGEVFVERVNKKRELSWVQKTWLNNFIALHYQGHYRLFYQPIPCDHVTFQKQQKILLCSRTVETFLADVFKKCDVDWHKPPLRLIFSVELSVLINLKFMELYL